MRSKALYRIDRTPLGLIVLLLAAILIAVLMSTNVFAAGTPTVTVGSGSGKVGEIVYISINISNSSDVGGVSFKISYDSAKIEPKDKDSWEWGSINRGMYMPNVGDGYIHIGIISADGAFSKDGTIVKVPFNLKSAGQTNLSISELSVSDKGGKSIECFGSNGSIAVTVVKTPLAQVGKPSWNGDIISWGTVDNAQSYQVILYKNGSEIRKVTVTHPNNSYDFAPDMGGAGRYTVTVQALSGSDLYSHGKVSPPSNERVKTEPLARVGKPTWDGNTIRWAAVANAGSYKVTLYKDGAAIQSKTVTGTACDFSEKINQATGSYTATVQALPGSSGLYTAGEISLPSDANNKTAALAKPGTPSWGDDSYTISWSAVEGAASYEVILYKNGSKNHSTSISTTSCDFTARINSEGPGFYTATVRAIADPKSSYINGPFSERSGEKIKSAVLAQVPRPAWSGNRLTWSPITGAVNYEIKLYKGNVPVDTRRVAGTQTSLDFSAMMQQLGAGSYSATVQALGDGKLYLDGAISARSVERNFAPSSEDKEVSEDGKPDIPDNAVSATPAWLPDPESGASTGTIAWRRDDDTVKEYKVTLYRGEAQVTTVSVIPGEADELLAYDFTEQLAEPGLYHVAIEALHDDGSSEPLDGSAIMVVTMETAEGSGVYRAEGFLPFAGLKIRFTSSLPVRGVFTLTRLDNTDYSLPEGLQPAGIFLAVEMDQKLAGVTARIEFEYDPDLLPEGLAVESLRVYRYNPEKEAWEPLESGVDTAAGLVWAELKQFSVLGIFGEAAAPEPEETAAGGWFDLSRIPYYFYPLLVIIVVALLFLLFRRRRRRRSKKRRGYFESGNNTYIDDEFGKPPYPLP